MPIDNNWTLKKEYFNSSVFLGSVGIRSTYRARPCEKTGPKNQWFKPVVSESKSLVRKKLITGLKKLTSGFWDLAKNSPKTTD